MPRFHAAAVFCTGTGDTGRWSCAMVASDIDAARSKAYGAFIARHRSATKVDMRTVPLAELRRAATRSNPTRSASMENIMQLRIDIEILDEARLRQFAAHRMSISGLDTDPATHIDEPLGDLLFEALIGSNSDTVAPIDMGIEIAGWTGHFPDRPGDLKPCLDAALIDMSIAIIP